MPARILAVDDSEANLVQIQLHLAEEDFVIATVTDGEKALQRMMREDFDLVLLDVVLPRMNGFEVCRRLKADPRTARVPVVFLTGEARDEDAQLQGFEVGGVDFLTKPFRRDELKARVRVALSLHARLSEFEETIREQAGELQALRRAGDELRAERDLLRSALAARRAGDAETAARLERTLEQRRAVARRPQDDHAAPTDYRIDGFVGESAIVRDVHALVDRLRDVRCPVLIHGETGTGKELVASALHYDGRFRDRPFIPIHCGAISPELIESELFGYERGAFTGAQTSKEGLFTAADGGTVFLDEVSECSLDLQVKLLRVLQLGEVRPVGANCTRHVDVRIIAATNGDLGELVDQGRFREDLYYRLECVTVPVPPLRRRLGDLEALCERFLEMWNRRLETPVPVRALSQATLAAMRRYSWPGNVRELENVLKSAIAIGRGEILQEEHLPERVRRGDRGGSTQRSEASEPVFRVPPPVAGNASLREQRADAERIAILRVLDRHGGDKKAAAAAMGVSRSTLYRRLKSLGLEGSEIERRHTADG